MLLQIVNHKPTVHTSLRINDGIKRTVKTGEAVKNAFTTLPSHKGQLDVVAGSLSYLAVTLHGLSHIALDLIHIRTHDVEWTVQTSSFVSGLSTSPIGSSLPQEVNTTGKAIIIRRMAIERYFFHFHDFSFLMLFNFIVFISTRGHVSTSICIYVSTYTCIIVFMCTWLHVHTFYMTSRMVLVLIFLTLPYFDS